MRASVPGSPARATGDRHERKIACVHLTACLHRLLHGIRYLRHLVGPAPTGEHGAPYSNRLGPVPRASEVVRRWLCRADRMRSAAHRLVGQWLQQARVGISHGPAGPCAAHGLRAGVQHADLGQAGFAPRRLGCAVPSGATHLSFCCAGLRFKDALCRRRMRHRRCARAGETVSRSSRRPSRAALGPEPSNHWGLPSSYNFIGFVWADTRSSTQASTMSAHSCSM